jgi:hypothetical protein
LSRWGHSYRIVAVYTLSYQMIH